MRLGEAGLLLHCAARLVSARRADDSSMPTTTHTRCSCRRRVSDLVGTPPCVPILCACDKLPSLVACSHHHCRAEASWLLLLRREKKHVVGRPLVHSPSAQLSRPADSGPRYCSGTERGRWRSSQPHRRGHYHDDCIDSRIAPAARLAPLRQVQRGLPGFARHRGTLHFRVRTDNAAAGGAACPAPSQAPYHMPPAGQLTDIVETAARDPASPSNVSDRR